MSLTKVTYSMIQGAPVNVLDYGADPTGTNDSYAAFAAAYTQAVAQNRALYIPGVAAGNFYKLTQALEITTDAFVVYGDGPSSMLCAYNATGLNAITVLADHVVVRDLGITGIAGSGHGIQAGTSAGTTAYFGTYENLWISWVGGNCLDIQRAICSVFTNINMDHETITSPVTLPGGVSKGARTNGVNIRLATPANNNDLTFVGCIVNAACNPSTGWEVQIGANGTGGLQSVFWTGGLIQSYPNLINIQKTLDVKFEQVYMEPSVSPGTITVADSARVNFSNCFLDADITFTNPTDGGYGNAIKDCYVNAVINNTTYQIVIDNITFGGVGGTLTDYSGKMKATSTISSSNAQVAIGNNFSAPYDVYFQTNMQEWLGGGSPTVPSGTYNFGATITRETVEKRTGNYSAKVVVGATSYATGLRIDIPADVISTGADILVEAWCKPATSGKLASVAAWWDGGAVTVQQNFPTSAQWHRMVVRFNASANTYTNGFILLSGEANQTFYFDAVRITVENYTPISILSLNSSSTPNVSVTRVSGPQVPTVITEASVASITGFTGQEVGKPFVVISGKTTCTFVDSATMQLSGGVDFVANAGDTITFVYGSDGVFRETSRSVL